MKFNKIKLLAAGLALAVAAVGAGSSVKAETKTNDPVVYEVGSTAYYNNVANLKINGKAPKKLKSKVKTITFAKYPSSGTYRTKAFFDTEDAYATVNDYNKENGSEAYKYYPATASYEVDFKKAGTYKISYTDYTWDDLYEKGSDENDNDVIKKYNIQTGSYDVLTKYVYVPSTYTDYYTNQLVTTYVDNGKTYTRAEESYYAGENGQNFKSYNGELCIVNLAKGADGLTHVKYTPSKRVSYTNVDVIKVVPSFNTLQQVKLGKSTIKNYSVGKLGGRTLSVKRGKFLSGKSGKVSVKMGSDYKLNSILVGTYDTDGNLVYKLAKNNSTVTYGTNKRITQSDPEATYKYYNESMYKPTIIYVAYDNKTSGEGTAVKSEGTDAEGNQTFVVEYKTVEKNPDTKKNMTLTTTYNITRKKATPEAKNYRYYYTKTSQYYDSATKTIQSDTYDSWTSSSSLPGLNDYTTVTFYAK